MTEYLRAGEGRQGRAREGKRSGGGRFEVSAARDNGGVSDDGGVGEDSHN